VATRSARRRGDVGVRKLDAPEDHRQGGDASDLIDDIEIGRSWLRRHREKHQRQLDTDTTNTNPRRSSVPRN